METLLLKVKLQYLKAILHIKSYRIKSLTWGFAIVVAFLIFLSPSIQFVDAQTQIPENKIAASSNLSDFTFGWAKGPEICRYVQNAANLVYCGWLIPEGTGGNTGTIGVANTIINAVGMGGRLEVEGEDGARSVAYVGGTGEIVSSSVGKLYESKPVDTGYYVNNIAEKLNPIKKVEAQTSTIVPSGRVILQVISSMHSAIINFIFLIYIFIFIVIAFAIMMRQKLSGGAYVTVVNTIPRILISLVLVAFSYPIAASVIDLGYLGMNILYDAGVNTIAWNVKGQEGKTLAQIPDDQQLGGVNGSTKKELVESLAPNSRAMNVFQVFSVTSLGDGNILPEGERIEFTEVELANEGIGKIANTLGNIFLGLLQVTGDTATGNTLNVSWLVVLIITIAALFSAFKLFFALLKEFINILFYPLAAPVMFAMYSLPGNDKIIMNWFKTYAGSVFSFVAVYGLFIIISLLGHQVVLNEGNSWNPFLLGFKNAPSVATLSSLVAYGLFILSPQVPDMVKKAIGSAGGGFDKYASTIADQTKLAAKRVTFGAVG